MYVFISHDRISTHKAHEEKRIYNTGSEYSDVTEHPKGALFVLDWIPLIRHDGHLYDDGSTDLAEKSYTSVHDYKI